MAESRATDAEVDRRRIQVRRLRFGQLSGQKSPKGLAIQYQRSAGICRPIHDGWVSSFGPTSTLVENWPRPSPVRDQPDVSLYRSDMRRAVRRTVSNVSTLDVNWIMRDDRTVLTRRTTEDTHYALVSSLLIRGTRGQRGP